MCTTTQYLYACQHPATHRFRNSVCPYVSRPANRQNALAKNVCRIIDQNTILPHDCETCEDRKARAKAQGSSSGSWRSGLNVFGPRQVPEKDLYQDTWYIPTRCFVDVGFQTLDPFGTGEDLETPQTPKSPAADRDDDDDMFGKARLPLLMEEELSDCSPKSKPKVRDHGDRRRNMKPPEIKRDKRQPSPCCVKERRKGAYQVTRLEGCEDRFEGRIVDSCCRSIV